MAAIFDMRCFLFCFMCIVRVSSSTLTALSRGPEGKPRQRRSGNRPPSISTHGCNETDDYSGWVSTQGDFGTLHSCDFRLRNRSVRPIVDRPYLLWFPVLPVYCRRSTPGLESRNTILLMNFEEAP